MDLAPSASYLGTDVDGRYRLERLVGQGATSWVFAARDLRLERDVAIKLLKPGTEPEHSLSFVQEGRMLASLTHSHVVAVHDAGETSEGLGYLVMELSHAGTLETELRRRSRLDPEETLRLMLPLLGALACAHDCGIVHRDLKPANIVLVKQACGKTRAKLLDFGIAKREGQPVSSGGAIGTPAYMAPEQARAESAGPSTDVWAMGVVAFRCLSGRLPFQASTSSAMLLKLTQERAIRLSTACPELPARVAVALDRALEPDPLDRYPDMRSFARMLALACRQDGVSIESDPDPQGLPNFASWLADADVEATRPEAHDGRVEALGADNGDAALRSGGPLVSTARRAPRLKTALLSGAIAAYTSAALWASLTRPMSTRGQTAISARYEHPAQQPKCGMDAPSMSVDGKPEPPAAEHLTEPSVDCSRVDPRASLYRSAVLRDRTRSRSDPAERGTRSAPTRRAPASGRDAEPAPVQSSAPAGHQVERVLPGLVTNWNW